MKVHQKLVRQGDLCLNQLCLPAGVGICAGRSSPGQSTRWCTGPCWPWCCEGHTQDPLPGDSPWDPVRRSVLGIWSSHRAPHLIWDHWEMERQSEKNSWSVSEHHHLLQFRLTWGWRGWSSGSGRYWCICGTAVWPTGLTAPASLTEVFPPPPSSPELPSVLSAALSPSTLPTAHSHGYHRIQQPATTLANTPLCLPPSDWEQAEIQFKLEVYARK